MNDIEKMYLEGLNHLAASEAVALAYFFYDMTGQKDLSLKREKKASEQSGTNARLGSSWGDEGKTAGGSFAATLWLIDHADILLWAINEAQKKSNISVGIDAVSLSQKIIEVLAEQIGLPIDEKLKFLSQLFIKVGIALQNISKDPDGWMAKAKWRLLCLAKQASLYVSGCGLERIILPWAFRIELFESQPISLEGRIDSLRMAIAGHEVIPLQMNRWAYFLLLAGRWRAATPMAILSTEVVRRAWNLDTLGWAYFFEGDIEKSFRVLDEALEKQDLIADPEDWAEIRYHQLYASLHSGRKSVAEAILENMIDKAPEAYWTDKATNLHPLFAIRQHIDAPSLDRVLRHFKYDIALSFAGADRYYAEQLAHGLKEHGVKVFYDEFEKADLWGKNLYSYLTDLYKNKAKYCIILVSKNYTSRRWANLEREAAQARAFSEDEEYILPVRLDLTVIPGLLPTVAYLDWNIEGMRGVVNCVLKKLKKEKTLDPLRPAPNLEL